MALDAPTLVLNKNWHAITTTTVREALLLLCRAAARAVCPASYEIFDLEAWLDRSARRVAELPRERWVATPSCAIEAPEVILLSAFGGVPRREVAFSRRNLYRRDGFVCQYCKRLLPPSRLSIDHVIPRSRGGSTSWENCVLACVRCNAKKGNRTPQESGLRLSRPPRRPSWSPLSETLPQRRPESWNRFLGKAAAG